MNYLILLLINRNYCHERNGKRYTTNYMCNLILYVNSSPVDDSVISCSCYLQYIGIGYMEFHDQMSLRINKEIRGGGSKITNVHLEVQIKAGCPSMVQKKSCLGS